MLLYSRVYYTAIYFAYYNKVNKKKTKKNIQSGKCSTINHFSEGFNFVCVCVFLYLFRLRNGVKFCKVQSLPEVRDENLFLC